MAETIIYNHTFKIVADEGELIQPDKIGEAEAMVVKARARLQAVAAWGTSKSMTDNFRACMRAYFFIDGDMSDAVWVNAVRKVISGLETVNREVQGDNLTLKPVKVEPGLEDAAAFVRRSKPDAIAELIRGADPNRPASFYGPLNLRFDRLYPTGTSAANLIHEATHLYLGTRDWAYLPNYDMLDYEEGFATAGIPPPAIPASVNAIKAWYDLSTEEALNNADSYAGFAMHLSP